MTVSIQVYCPNRACCAIRWLLLGKTKISDEIRMILGSVKNITYEDLVEDIMKELEEYCEKEIAILKSQGYGNVRKLCEYCPSIKAKSFSSEEYLSYNKIVERCTCNIPELGLKFSISKQTVVDAAKAISMYVQLKVKEKLQGVKSERTIIDVLEDVRRERKRLCGVSKLKPDTLTEILLLRLQGLTHKQIAQKLGLTANIVRWVLDQLQHMIATYSRGIGVRIIYNRGLRFFKIESRTIYPTDPEALLEAIRRLIEIDKTSESSEEFKNKAQQLIKEYNRILKPFGIKLELRKGSPFERKRRPYALRIRRKR